MNHSCKFCGETFVRAYGLNRHNNNNRCKIQKNPELLLKYIAEQENRVKLMAEQNVLILEEKAEQEERIKLMEEQNVIIMEEIKELKNKPSQKISTVNIGDHNNVVINNFYGKIYSFQPADIKFIIDNLTKSTFGLDNIIPKFAKMYENNQLKKAMKLILESLHNNPKCKKSQNILYCNHGEHEGKFMTYHHPEWFISNINTILDIVKREIDLCIEDVESCYGRKVDEETEQNQTEFIERSRHMDKYKEFITDVVKEFIKSKAEEYPEVSEKDHPLEVLSEKAKKDKVKKVNLFDGIV